jgi:hypothetical protein
MHKHKQDVGGCVSDDSLFLLSPQNAKYKFKGQDGLR